ncbi:pyrroloquinoline quinone biosynthesis protein PqqB [Paracoccus sp. Z118]|uniref:pyrroloquinoline quinone biosynthesis protein PqqB n=1 Tax=Paracoccus sp. Z118 TaxID=2851017 RepID=UPI001C2C7932|nr:pyrroloquinoline quinone biosynthesis protein PqqB [Paracoccus sp. Z118]MBV0892077.1 pyrroloquinoline quinone biosynthesis protein PqqB [Paracoccus sp. Z118]
MKLTILGAAAGGGLPQWNCGCANCDDARAGRIARMTQSSVAVSVAGERVILNASPDIRAQLDACGLHPAGLRGSPAASVVLTNGDVDHVAGLLSLRESSPFTVHATSATLDILRQPIFRVLNPDHVSQSPIALDQPFQPVPGLTVTPFAVPGKVALYLEEGEPDTALMGEQTVGLKLEADGRTAFYIPGCAAVTGDLLARLDRADLLMFDGTVWANDEMARTGTGAKTGARMGHMAMSGPEGSIACLAGLTGTRRVFVHINNTNPVLQPGSPERAELEAAGWELAHDGMEMTL